MINKFKNSSIIKRLDKYQIGGNIGGKYLNKIYRDYYSHFKSYNDFINSQSYKNIADVSFGYGSTKERIWVYAKKKPTS